MHSARHRRRLEKLLRSKALVFEARKKSYFSFILKGRGSIYFDEFTKGVPEGPHLVP